MNFQNLWTWINKTMTDPVFYGAASHFLGGAALILITAFLSGSFRWTGVVWVVFFGLTLFKEFYWDTHWEIPLQDIRGGTRDFLSYQAGTSLALLVAYLKLVVFK